jgi:hypothetical protein
MEISNANSTTNLDESRWPFWVTDAILIIGTILTYSLFAIVFANMQR